MRRAEDRRSCHNVSFILGLAIASHRKELAVDTFLLMVNLVTPVRNQAPN